METSMALPQNTELPYDSVRPLLGTYPQELKARTPEQLYNHVHKRQKREASHVSTDGRTDTSVWCIHSGILSRLRRR